jgi:hypothetical protein
MLPLGPGIIMSLLSQRITLIITLCTALGYTAHINMYRKSHYSIVKIDAPELPAPVNEFHYGEFEKAVASFQFDDKGKYVPDAKSVSRLVIAMENNLAISNPSVLERFKYLLSKQLPSEVSKDVFSLMHLFIVYTQKKMKFHISDVKRDDTINHFYHFQQLTSIQNETFGKELAEQLFGDQRRITEKLYSISNNSKANK